MLFPITAVQEDSLNRPAHLHGGAATGIRSTGEHLLVVEDSAEVLELAQEILGAAGYRVTTAESGEAALKLFDQTASGTFDLLFTDLVMPGGMNGLILAEEIGRRDPTIGILLTTGYNEELVVSGPDRPQKDVLGKPYRRSELLDRIRQSLDNRPGQAADRRTPSEYGAAES
jgi:CheY-like chemotaxis protein